MTARTDSQQCWLAPGVSIKHNSRESRKLECHLFARGTQVPLQCRFPVPPRYRHRFKLFLISSVQKSAYQWLGPQIDQRHWRRAVLGATLRAALRAGASVGLVGQLCDIDIHQTAVFAIKGKVRGLKKRASTSAHGDVSLKATAARGLIDRTHIKRFLGAVAYWRCMAPLNQLGTQYVQA